MPKKGACQVRKLPVAIFLLFCSLQLLACTAGCKIDRGVQSSPKGTVSAFFQAFQEKDVDTLLALNIDSHAGREEREFLLSLMEMVEINSYQILSTEISGDQASVEVSVSMTILNRLSTRNYIYDLLKRDGNWYMAEENDLLLKNQGG